MYTPPHKLIRISYKSKLMFLISIFPGAQGNAYQVSPGSISESQRGKAAQGGRQAFGSRPSSTLPFWRMSMERIIWNVRLNLGKGLQRDCFRKLPPCFLLPDLSIQNGLGKSEPLECKCSLFDVQFNVDVRRCVQLFSGFVMMSFFLNYCGK